MSFYIKQNDTSPSLRSFLRDGDGDPIDLTGATVKFLMRPIGGTTLKINDSAVIVTALSGLVQYEWEVGDTDTVGSYQAEFEVTYTGGDVETFPNNGYIRVEVTDDLG